MQQNPPLAALAPLVIVSYSILNSKLIQILSWLPCLLLCSLLIEREIQSVPCGRVLLTAPSSVYLSYITGTTGLTWTCVPALVVPVIVPPVAACSCGQPSLYQ